MNGRTTPSKFLQCDTKWCRIRVMHSLNSDRTVIADFNLYRIG